MHQKLKVVICSTLRRITDNTTQLINKSQITFKQFYTYHFTHVLLRVLKANVQQFNIKLARVYIVVIRV